MTNINSTIASVVDVEGQKYFRMIIDNGALSYSKLINDDNDFNNAVKNATNILRSIPEYEKYVLELEALIIA